MTEETIQVGDVVKLKSGGPPMVVHSVSKLSSGQFSVGCTYFDANDQSQIGMFLSSIVTRDENAEEAV